MGEDEGAGARDANGARRAAERHRCDEKERLRRYLEQVQAIHASVGAGVRRAQADGDDEDVARVPAVGIIAGDTAGRGGVRIEERP